jgi:formylglycine-generating enzyme required for sulfatase activity
MTTDRRPAPHASPAHDPSTPGARAGSGGGAWRAAPPALLALALALALGGCARGSIAPETPEVEAADDDDPTGKDAKASAIEANAVEGARDDGSAVSYGAQLGDPTRPLACDTAASATTPLVPLPGGGSIDATEVTQCQYAAWLATKPSTTGQSKACGFNHDFAPADGCLLMAPCVGRGCERHPQVCVDWCDAHAYCAAHDKHLCGAIGGGALAFDEAADPAKSEWTRACTGGLEDTKVFPYGPTHLPNACNGLESGVGFTAPVGTMPLCVGDQPGFEGVHDLSGNVFEWEDSCDGHTGSADHCRVRGGAFWSDWEVNWCGSLEINFAGRGFADGDGWAYPGIGFRCCGD